MVKQFFYTAVLLLTFTASAFAELTAHVDRKAVRVDETLMLIIKSDKPLTRSPDLNGISKALQPLSQMQFSNSSYKNGKRLSESGWKIQLIALEEGIATIPSFNIDNETTSPIQITVLKANQSDVNGGLDPLFSEVSLSDINPFVQQQIILTVKISSDSDIDNAQLVAPKLGSALVRSLGEPTEYVSRLSGKLYRIQEYKFSIFPQQEGLLEIPPMLFQGNKIVRYRSRSPLSLLSSQSRTVRLRTEAITLDVKPALPSSHTWLPASSFKVKSYWRPEPQKLTVGEPITRVIEIEAEGLDATQLTEFTMPEIDGISWFPNPAERNNFFDGKQISSKLTQRFALMPNKAGHYQLPAIELHWYNIKTRQFQIARIDSREIVVDAAVILPNIIGSNSANIPAKQSTLAEKNVDVINTQAATELVFWKILAITLSVLWLISVVAFFYLRKKNHRAELTQKNKSPDSKHPADSISSWKVLAKQIQGCSAIAAYKLITIKAGSEFKDFDSFVSFTEASGNGELATALRQLSKDAFSKNSQRDFDQKLSQLLAKLPEQLKVQTHTSKKDKIAPLYD